MVVMAIPTWFFAFGNSATQLIRLALIYVDRRSRFRRRYSYDHFMV